MNPTKFACHGAVHGNSKGDILDASSHSVHPSRLIPGILLRSYAAYGNARFAHRIILYACGRPKFQIRAVGICTLLWGSCLQVADPFENVLFEEPGSADDRLPTSRSD